MKKITIVDGYGKTVLDTYLFESDQEKREYYDGKRRELATQSEGIKKLQDWVTENGHQVLEFMMVTR